MTLRARLALSLAAVASLVVGASVATEAQTSHPRVVDDNPANTTPHLYSDGSGVTPRVLALSKWGDTTYIGGIFRRLENPQRRNQKVRHNLAAFDADTGTIRTFAPRVNGPVWAIQTTKRAVYIGGEVTRGNGVRRHGLAKRNRRTGTSGRAL